MELKEPRRKKRARLEPKSSLPLVFSKGELTKFHANLTAVGSCIADPTEMEIIFKMGYFGKGSLSRSDPTFGRIRYGAPPVIRNRQWQRRQEWISEVQKLSADSFFNDDTNEHDQSHNEETKQETETENIENDSNISKNLNDTIGSDISITNEILHDQEKPRSEIEILDHDLRNVQTNGQSTESNVDIDEVILDSAEEDVCEILADSYRKNNIENMDLFYVGELSHLNSAFSKDFSDLQGKVLVLPDSDSDTENYLSDIKPEIKHESFPVRETLHLTFEETFFLMYGLGCLTLIDYDGKYLSIGETWHYFCKEQKFFVQKYVAYHYFRSKGWIVKPGLKYGGDFLLYKEGPPFYHSSYIVIIDVLDADTFKRLDNKSLRNMTWNKFIGLERLAESVAKEVLFAQVLWPSSVATDIIPNSPEVLSQFTVREILWRRWKLSNNSLSANTVENDEDEDEDGYSS